MGHKAIIKCQRSDAEWYFNDKRRLIEEYKNQTLSDRYGWKSKGGYPFFDYHQYETHWLVTIRKHGVNRKLYSTGHHALWEGYVELETLSIGHHIFVEPLNQYFSINKVEVNPNGTVTYYINYKKEFLNVREVTRLQAIEDWLEVEYPNVQKFEELKKHKDDVDKYKADYERYLQGYYSPVNQRKLEEKNKAINIEKVEKTEECTYEKLPQQQAESMSTGDVVAVTSVIFLVSFVVLMVAYFIINQ